MLLSCVRLFATPWTVALQALLGPDWGDLAHTHFWQIWNSHSFLLVSGLSFLLILSRGPQRCSHEGERQLLAAQTDLGLLVKVQLMGWTWGEESRTLPVSWIKQLSGYWFIMDLVETERGTSTCNRTKMDPILDPSGVWDTYKVNGTGSGYLILKTAVT